MRFIERLSDYSDEAILAELRRVAAKLKKTTLTKSDLCHARISYTLLKERFGGLRKALDKAGLRADLFYRNIPDIDLLVELKRIWDLTLKTEARRPHKRDMRRYGCKYSHSPYVRRWGSWIKACEALLEWEETQGSPSYDVSVRNDANAKDKKARPKQNISLRLRYEVLKRDGFRCLVCGRSPATHQGIELHIDHIHPESKGGETNLENLRTLCSECNLGKGNSL